MSEESFLSCGAMIKRLAEITDRNANNELSKNDVTFSQLRILIMLRESIYDSLSLKEIERYFDLTQATVAGIIVRLERKNFLEGFTDPADRRIKRVRITQQGIKLCDDTKLFMDGCEERLLRCLDEEERLKLQEYLSRICRDMQQD